MRLSVIKLAGFKSFVDPTVIELKSDLVAVLGPNGCGKSNVIDAVRWVMGESSAKNLRGGQITDVIFSGSTTRKPVGMATVELIFDNSDGTIGAEYAQYQEVSIKRQVTRDGQSTYFINQVKCRRRDITDIFLGTGLGPRSYAIIEQGMISRLIEAKPDDLRVFLEEAAGISKYKERRRETENRIKHTRENLDRLTDLRQELEKQLSRLERQSHAANKYKAFKEELNLSKAQLLALQHQQHDMDLAQFDTLVLQLQNQLEAARALGQNAQTQIEKHRQSHTEAAEGLTQVQKNYYGIGTEISKQEMAISHHEELKKKLNADLEGAKEGLTKAQSQLGLDQDQCLEWQTDLSDKKPALEEIAHELSAAKSQLGQANESMDDWRLDWDSFIEGAQAPQRQADVQRAHITRLENQSRHSEKKANQLREEYGNLKVGDLSSEIAQEQQYLDEKQGAVGEFEEAIQSARGKQQTTQSELQQENEALNTCRKQLQVAKGQQASLQALQEDALAHDDAQASAWLNQQGLSDKARLASLIDVEEGWAQAVEAVLAPYLDAVCVDDLESVCDEVSVDSGAFTLLAPSAATSATTAGLTPLAEKVRAGLDRARGLLSNCYIIDSLSDAFARREQLADTDTFVTPEGIMLSRHCLRMPETTDAGQSILVREKTLSALKETITTLDTQESQRVASMQALKQTLSEQEDILESARQKRNRLVNDIGQLKANISGKQSKLQSSQDRQIRLETEQAELQSQIAEADEEIKTARQTLDTAIELMADNDEKRITLKERKQVLIERVQDARETFQAAQSEHQGLVNAVSRLEAQIEASQESIRRFSEQVDTLLTRESELKERLSTHDEPLPGLQQSLEVLLERRLTAEGELNQARQFVGEIEAALRSQEDALRQATAEQERHREVLDKAKMDWQTAKVKREGIEEQLAQTEFKVEALLEAMPQEANVPDWTENIETLERKIQRLGPINLAAIEEFDSEKERKEYLDAQDADLSEALDVLENAIRKIDKETRDRFKDTYEEVQQGFRHLFPKLFGGGEADLVLTGDDLLDTGVSVMARPPGKKNALITQLSGGEKALTAVALVFAIFQLNPAPFCLLDEVDAPLDDANVSRFCKMVKEMSEQVQFIYITHNKVTMEMADYLMGVTMKEPGVSRLVTVDMSEAVEMAEA